MVLLTEKPVVKYGFCNKLLLYECKSDQLPISFIKTIFTCNQNIGETLNLKKRLSNILITGWSNSDEWNGQVKK